MIWLMVAYFVLEGELYDQYIDDCVSDWLGMPSSWCNLAISSSSLEC